MIEIERRHIKGQKFNPEARPPDPVDLRVEVENEFEIAFDKRRPFRERLSAFIRGENKAGRTVGMVVDFATLFVPGSVVKAREAAQLIVNKTTRTMPRRIKPYLKQKSTWEGVAAVLGAIGIVIYPAAIVEIVAGVLTVIGGIELWKKEAEDE